MKQGKKIKLTSIFNELDTKNIEELENYYISNLLSMDALRIILYKYALYTLFYRERIILYNEPEDLHQFRISIRKSRAFLKVFKSLIPKKYYHYIYEHLTVFASKTNKKRDLDVIGQHFTGSDENVMVIQEVINSQKAQEDEKIEAMLRGQSFNTFFFKYHDILKNETLFKSQKDSIENTASTVLRNLHLKIIHKIDAIEKKYNDDELHSIRISFKKLRYLLEEFQHIFGDAKIKKIIKDGKKLQTILGDYNDIINETALLHDFFQTHLRNMPDTEELEEIFIKRTNELEESLKRKSLIKLHEFKKKPFKL